LALLFDEVVQHDRGQILDTAENGVVGDEERALSLQGGDGVQRVGGLQTSARAQLGAVLLELSCRGRQAHLWSSEDVSNAASNAGRFLRIGWTNASANMSSLQKRVKLPASACRQTGASNVRYGSIRSTL